MTRLIWNTKNQTLATVLEESAQDADAIYIAVAFFTQGGWRMIKDWLQASVERGCQVELFVGTDFYQTDPSALLAVEALLRDKPDCTLWVCSQNSRAVFHPKMYVFKTAHDMIIVVGSANLTEGGLANNREVCCLFSTPVASDTASEIQAIFNAYRADRQNVKRATLLDITAYEARWKRYCPQIRRISKETIAKIDALPSFHEDKLQQYLQDYHVRESRNYEDRVKRYQKAPAKLDELMVIQTKAEFLQVYGDLVGKAGGGGRQLWYSGGLFRNKNRVADGFVEVREMIKTIREHSDASPAELFNLGLPHVKQVYGLGVNILTEVMHTYYPERCPVLNNNSLGSLRKLGIAHFPEPQSFKPVHYQRFTDIIDYLRNRCRFQSLGQVDHFLNHIYHKFVKSSSEYQE